MLTNIIQKPHECKNDLEEYINNTENYGYTEDALQNLTEAIETLNKAKE